MVGSTPVDASAAIPLRALIVTTQFDSIARTTPLSSDLVDAFRGAGDEVTLLVLDWSSPGQPYRRERLSNGATLIYLSPPMPRWGPPILRKAIKWLWAPFHAVWTLRQKARDERFDVMVGFSIATALLGPFLWASPRATRRCLFVTDFFPFHNFAIGSMPGGLPFHIARLIETWVFRRFDAIGCMSEAGVAYLRRRYRLRPQQKAFVLPLWTSAKTIPRVDRKGVRARYGLPLKGPIAVFGGQLCEGRGIEELVAAASAARGLRPDLTFLVLGNGVLEPKVTNYANQPGSNMVHFRALPHRDYLELISACDIGIVATVEGVDVPTFPSKTMDYLRAGLAVVAAVEASTDYGTFIETHGFGLATRAGDADALLERLLVALNDPPGMRRMQTAARRAMRTIFDASLARARILNALGLASPPR